MGETSEKYIHVLMGLHAKFTDHFKKALLGSWIRIKFNPPQSSLKPPQSSLNPL